MEEKTGHKMSEEEVEAYIQKYKKFHTPWKRTKKVYRNELCRCGSGKKTKYCCGLDNKYEY